MKKAVIFAVLALTLAGTAFAEETQHCYNGNGSYIHICEFSPSGRVNLTEDLGEHYYSTWFTRREWLKYKNNPNHITVYREPTNTKSEAQAQSWRTQDGCEADGFLWHDGGCHAK
jgi:hypothetical protein